MGPKSFIKRVGKRVGVIKKELGSGLLLLGFS
jgi:hypothetical protein